MTPAPRHTAPWQPGSNPLTHERPFARRRMEPVEAAVYTACLGPALCLGYSTLAWLVVLVGLPLLCLLLGALPWPARFAVRHGLWPSLLLLGLVPPGVAGLAWVLQVIGAAPDLPVLETSLLLTVHGGAFLYLQEVGGRVEEDRRRASVRAAFLLPLPLLALWVAGALERLLVLPAGLAGLPRLALVVLGLGVFQWVRRRMGHTGPVPEGGPR